MAFHDNDRYHSNTRAGGSATADTPIETVDREEIERKAKAMLSANNLADSLQVHRSADGKKASWLFFNNLSPEVASLLQYGYNIILPKLNDYGAGFFYDVGKNLTGRLFSKSQAATQHKVGLNAARVFMAALIAADPVQKLFRARSDYNDQREQLFNDIRPVIDGNKNYKHNEVIAVALREISTDAASQVKKVVANLPVLGIASYYGVKDFARLKQAKTSALNIANQTAKSEASLNSSAHELWVKRDKMIDEGLAKLGDGVSEERKERYVNDMRRKFERQDELAHDQLLREQDSPLSTSNALSDSTAWLTLAGGAELLLRSKIGKRQGSKDIALNKIVQLKKDLDEHSVPDLRERVIEIFQQNERDHGRAIVGDRLMPKLEPAIDRIVEVIEEGRLSPLALVNLVGEGKVLKLQGGKRGFATAAQVDDLISDQLKTLSTREEISKEEFYSNFVNPVFVEQTLKETMQALPAEQRDIVAALFPAEIIEQIGYKRHDVIEMQKRGHDRLYPLIAARALEIAGMSEAEQRKLGLNEKDMRAVRSLAEDIAQAGRIDPVKRDVDGHEKEVLAAVRTAALNEQTADKQGPGFWSNLIGRAAGLPDLIAQAKEKLDRGSALAREDARREEKTEHAAARS